MTHHSDTPAAPVVLQDQRLRPPLQAQYPGAGESVQSWRAVAFSAGKQDFLIAASALLAVTPYPAEVTSLAGSAAWFAGLVMTEHGVVAVTDLAGFIAETTQSRAMTGQLLLLKAPLSSTALHVDKVYGLQRITARPSTEKVELPDNLSACCNATVMHQHKSWPLINPFKLCCNRRFMDITAD